MTEISAMYEALDNMDDYALMANVKPIGPHKVLTDAIAELEQLRQRVQELEQQLTEVRRAERERVAQMILNGRFLHDESPAAQFSKEVAAAIRAME